MQRGFLTTTVIIMDSTGAHSRSTCSSRIVSEEGFMKSVKPINFLKIRASWGVNGNDKIGDFKYVSTVGGGRNSNNVEILATGNFAAKV